MEREWRVHGHVTFTLTDVVGVIAPPAYHDRLRADVPMFGGASGFLGCQHHASRSALSCLSTAPFSPYGVEETLGCALRSNGAKAVATFIFCNSSATVAHSNAMSLQCDPDQIIHKCKAATGFAPGSATMQ
jgi:hypothetical protein